MADSNTEQRIFETGGITVHLNTAPPVYAPGGPVAFAFSLPEGATAQSLKEAETEAARRGAVLLVVQCNVESVDQETLLRAQGYTYASSWYLGKPLSIAPLEQSSLTIRPATAADVPRILEIGERKREQYDTFSPVFWKKAPTPREEFAPYVTSQVESEQNVALVAEADGAMHGYLIAQYRNLAEGYIDDYAVADPHTDWPGAGVALLSVAEQLAEERGVETIMIVTGHADAPKRAAAEQRGFTLRKNWLVKPLSP
ncbi:MAG: GNAT family N-acetyltransferase [Armatimonas sp.]